MIQYPTKLPQLPRTILVMVGLLAVAIPAWADPAPEEPTDPLLAAYQAWTSALEADADNSRWTFPFDAPKPDDLTSPDLKTVLSLRRLVRGGETEQLAGLVDIVVRRQEEMPAQMQFWLAYALGTLQRDEACVTHLEALLLVPEGHEHLETGQRAWVLTAYADYSFLLERRSTAARLYRLLAASPVEQVNLWGQYQLAGMEFIKREFTDANRRYKLVCEAENSGSWREHACAMAEIAARLSSFDLKGEAHGSVAVVSP